MSNRPLLLDLFCGAGGCAVGYHRAGFDVVGVDHKPQPRYPFEFMEADVIMVLEDLLEGWPVGGFASGPILSDFAAIHASPPCQEHSSLRHRTGKTYATSIVETRAMLRRIGHPFVIENVPGAPLESPVVLCGASFDLRTQSEARGEVWLKRHRLFESNAQLSAPPCACSRERKVIGVYGNGDGGGRGWKGTMRDRRSVMGIDWMTRDELAQAIPPAYTEYIGKQLLRVIAPSQPSL